MSNIDPALVTTIVEQVLASLQGMQISNSHIASVPDSESSDGEIVEFNELAPASVVPANTMATPASISDAESSDGEIVEFTQPANAISTAPAAATAAVAPAAIPPPTAIPVSADKWYMISAGHEVGVFQGWHIVRPLVIGVSHACCKKYASQAAAQEAFAHATAAGVVTVIP